MNSAHSIVLMLPQRLVDAIVLAILLLATAALADPLPVLKPQVGGSCPHGYSTSGSYCVPRAAPSPSRRTALALGDGQHRVTACAPGRRDKRPNYRRSRVSWPACTSFRRLEKNWAACYGSKRPLLVPVASH
jgi:hypothetical protein